MVAKMNNIRNSIYLIDSYDIPSTITALAKNMSVSFPQTSHLNLCFKRRCQIVNFLLLLIGKVAYTNI